MVVEKQDLNRGRCEVVGCPVRDAVPPDQNCRNAFDEAGGQASDRQFVPCYSIKGSQTENQSLREASHTADGVQRISRIFQILYADDIVEAFHDFIGFDVTDPEICRDACCGSPGTGGPDAADVHVDAYDTGRATPPRLDNRLPPATTHLQYRFAGETGREDTIPQARGHASSSWRGAGVHRATTRGARDRTVGSNVTCVNSL